MDANLVKSYKGYRRTESRNKHSWWWDSHISPKNSKWLAENVEEMDQSVKRMLKLIEEEGDSFAKKAEMYYQKRPQLVSHVEEFYRMYRSLAERYDNVTGELRKNIPSDLQSLQSQGSGVSDVSSEPPLGGSGSNPRRGSRSGTRAAGFDVFLKSGGSSSDLVTKEGDESSTLDSESESDDSSVNNYSVAFGNSDHKVKKIADVESEVRKNEQIEEELRVANEKIRDLTTELQKYESMSFPPQHSEDIKSFAKEGSEENDRKIATLEVDLKSTKEKLMESESEVKRLKHEIEKNASGQKEVLSWKSKYEKEKREVSKINDRVTRYKTNLSERDREIRAMRETLSNANKTLSEENLELQEHVNKLLKERALLDDVIKEWDLRCQCSEEEVRRIKMVNTGMESEIEELKVKVSELEGLVVLKDGEIEGLSGHLRELHLEHVELVEEIDKSKKSIEELEREIERQKGVIEEGGEEKREVIRQLCFSLEHYRDGYQMMRQVFMGQNKRQMVMT